jgi:uncharacterized membrane protein YfcA
MAALYRLQKISMQSPKRFKTGWIWPSAVSGAMLFHWLAPVQAVPLLLACSITTQLLSITKLWGTMRWRQCTPYLVGGFVGIPVGVKLLQHFSPYAFAAGFGIFLVCYSGYMLPRPRFTISAAGALPKLLLALPAVSPAGRPRFRAPFQRSCAAYAAYRKRSSAASFNHSSS